MHCCHRRFLMPTQRRTRFMGCADSSQLVFPGAQREFRSMFGDHSYISLCFYTRHVVLLCFPTPSWCFYHRVSLNTKKINAPWVGQFSNVERTQRTGDSVLLQRLFVNLAMSRSSYEIRRWQCVPQRHGGRRTPAPKAVCRLQAHAVHSAVGRVPPRPCLPNSCAIYIRWYCSSCLRNLITSPYMKTF